MGHYTPLIVSGLSAIMVVLILLYSLNTTAVSITGSFVAGFTEGKGAFLFVAALIGTCISCLAAKCYFDGKCN